MAKQLEGGAGRRMDVVEHEHHRVTTRGRFEPAGERVEHPKALRVRIRLDWRLEIAEAIGDLGDEARELGRVRTESGAERGDRSLG
jgi:hypothetical protein